MYNSINYFQENSIKEFAKLQENLMSDPSNMNDYVLGVTETVHNLGLQFIKETLETMDELIRKSVKRKKSWFVESYTDKQLITSLGVVQFRKTLYKNKETGERKYLLDQLMKLEPKQRMSEDAIARMLEEAVDTSYRRGGEESSLTAQVSKQTVKNKLHQIHFPKAEYKNVERKQLKYLYIDADEDHVSLQFQERKGDLRRNKRGRKNNCLFTKLVYVYEGVEPEAPKGKRNRLVNPKYFCSVSPVQTNEEFWKEIYEYIEGKYDIDTIEKIYVNSDGGKWIKEGMKYIPNTQHVLDEFHLKKYITKLTGHLKDSQEDAMDEVYYIVRNKGMREFKELVEKLKACTDNDLALKRVEMAGKYIESNWGASKLRLKHRKGVLGSSTEGHVSHVLASRMSSRPMGWSVIGGGKMAQLRAYHLNGGKMIDLVRYQKQHIQVAAGAEEKATSAHDIAISLRSDHGEIAKYLSVLECHIPTSQKGRISFYRHFRNF